MKKSILLLALSFIITCSVYALQGNNASNDSSTDMKIRRIGLQAGINSSKMVFTKITDQDIFNELEFFPRFNAGFYSESGASQNFVTQIGLFYSGGGYNYPDDENDVNATIKIDYIKVPLVFNFRTEIIDRLAFLVGTGPYAAFGFNAIEEINGETNRDILSFSTDDIEDNKPYNHLDFGLKFSSGLEFELNNDQLLKFGVSYDFGISTVSNEKDLSGDNTTIVADTGAKNRILSFHLTYMLNLLDQ